MMFHGSHRRKIHLKGIPERKAPKSRINVGDRFDHFQVDKAEETRRGKSKAKGMFRL